MTPRFHTTASSAYRHAAKIPFLATALVVLLAGCETRPPAGNKDAASTPAPAATTAASQVERGRYLVTVVGCNDCHTPLVMTSEGPRHDMTRMLSGHPASMVMPPPELDPNSPWGFTGALTLTAFAGPWGISYAANLTPHVNGLAPDVWTEELFIKAIRTGRHMGTSRPIMPPMPWMWAAQMTDDDLKAMWAYLRTIPPIDNIVPDYQPPAEGMAPPHGAPAEGQAAH